MKPVDRDEGDSRLEEAATEWLLEREEGFSADRAEAFAQWCASDPRHRAAVARVERTLALLDELPAVRSALAERLGGVGDPGRRRFGRWSWAAGLAAAVVVGVSSWWGTRAPAIESQSYAASATAPRRISLPDGTVVDLNAKSRFEVTFSKHERDVILLAGEAHFQVAHNAARPFVVTARGIAVRAVGTAFDVHLSGSSNVDVLVAEGKVTVGREERSSFFGTRTTPVVPLLVAGERTEVDAAGDAVARVEKVAPAEVRALLAWQDRLTSFTDVPLSEMVARINRCNAVRLVIGDPQLGSRRVGGVIDLNKVDAFVRFLEQDGDIVAERTSTGEIVLRSAR